VKVTGGSGWRAAKAVHDDVEQVPGALRPVEAGVGTAEEAGQLQELVGVDVVAKLSGVLARVKQQRDHEPVEPTMQRIQGDGRRAAPAQRR
jgi:hypothetical protein